MATFLLRVELPDRPGALGAVASRIGAVRGDLVAVEVVEHREGKAVDEFVVALADGDHLSLLLSEVAEVDGVAVQDVRPVSGRRHDRRLEAYTTALIIMKERTPHGVLDALAARVCAELDATWSAVLDVEGDSVVASVGRPPTTSWLVTSLTEARAGHRGDRRGRHRSPAGRVRRGRGRVRRPQRLGPRARRRAPGLALRDPRTCPPHRTGSARRRALGRHDRWRRPGATGRRLKPGSTEPRRLTD